jgi:hypothetical protein
MIKEKVVIKVLGHTNQTVASHNEDLSYESMDSWNYKKRIIGKQNYKVIIEDHLKIERKRKIPSDVCPYQSEYFTSSYQK